MFTFFKGQNNMWLKETVNVSSNDPPCKHDIARFTMVPLKPLSDQV